jgi:hypothetical protein
MTTYTSSLPKTTLENLAKFANELKIPKNLIIQRALDAYLKELDKALMRKSFAQYADDKELLLIAEEGLSDYIAELKLEDEAR